MSPVTDLLNTQQGHREQRRLYVATTSSILMVMFLCVFLLAHEREQFN